MAAKSPRVFIHLVCSVCQSQNYTTKKNKMNTPDKLELHKYCKFCRKSTPHKETQKMK